MYTRIKDFHKAEHYYEIVEKYFLSEKEFINLNYLYYDMAKLFF
jgi:hypothetical protein